MITLKGCLSSFNYIYGLIFPPSELNLRVLWCYYATSHKYTVYSIRSSKPTLIQIYELFRWKRRIRIANNNRITFMCIYALHGSYSFVYIISLIKFTANYANILSKSNSSNKGIKKYMILRWCRLATILKKNNIILFDFFEPTIIWYAQVVCWSSASNSVWIFAQTRCDV